MGTVITTARDGLLPSARAWKEVKLSLDGSRGFSEGLFVQVWEGLRESETSHSSKKLYPSCRPKGARGESGAGRLSESWGHQGGVSGQAL